jgi:hypothetical protein
MIAAAATAGAIIGFGVRHNDWSGPFQSLGDQVLLGLGVSSPTLGLSTMTGIAAHLAWMIVWGIAFIVLAHRKTSALVLLVALLVGSVAVLAARTVVPAATGALSFAGMPGIQAALCVALMIAGFVTGRALSRAD